MALSMSIRLALSPLGIDEPDSGPEQDLRGMDALLVMGAMPQAVRECVALPEGPGYGSIERQWKRATPPALMNLSRWSGVAAGAPDERWLRCAW